MSLTRSTHYKRGDTESIARREQAEAAARSAIENVVADWPCYGYRRVTHELPRRGIVINHKRVARFVATTDSNHDLPIYPDLTQSLVLTGPDQLWVADLTYIRLRTQFVYFAAILDAWSRKLVGYALGNTLETRLTLAALDAAIADRLPNEGLIHHSDSNNVQASCSWAA
jgi:putative transposase